MRPCFRILKLYRTAMGARFLEKAKINVEFVSANPTGPMHRATPGRRPGRLSGGGADARGLSGLPEFYINDAGNQIDKFAPLSRYPLSADFQGEEAVPCRRTATRAPIF